MKLEFKLDYKTWVFTLDEQVWRRIDVGVVGRGVDLAPEWPTLAELKEAFSQWEYLKVRLFVMKRLAHRSYATFEMEKLLLERGVETHCAQKVIEAFEREGYLNNESWLESFIRLHQLKRMGPFAIQAKLRMKGVPTALIEEALKEHFSDADKEEILTRLIAKKMGNKTMTFKEKQKLVGFLIRRGFSQDQIFANLCKFNK